MTEDEYRDKHRERCKRWDHGRIVSKALALERIICLEQQNNLWDTQKHLCNCIAWAQYNGEWNRRNNEKIVLEHSKKRRSDHAKRVRPRRYTPAPRHWAGAPGL